MVKFVKYPSIENAYRQKFIHEIQAELDVEDNWAVVEKIHGANFSFIISDEGIRCAKRSGMIRNDEKFFDYKNVANKYADRLQALYNDIKLEYDCDVIQVVGELFGGTYKGEKSDVKSVQKEVQYAPFQDFVMFDILINGEFLDYSLVCQLGIFHGILPPPLLGWFSLEQALSIPCEFITKIPSRYGLPPLEGNVCEGLIIRPNKNHWLGEPFKTARVIIKNKNEKFSERTVKELQALPSELVEIADLAKSMVEKNRIASAVSKTGAAMKDFSSILKEINTDVLSDMPEAYKLLDRDATVMVNKLLNKHIAVELKKYLISIGV